MDARAAVTDTYSLDAFGRSLGGWSDPTVNPDRYGAAWGYTTDTPGSGLLLLGARTYRPEVGRFLQQDPLLDGANWYAYAGDNPVVWIDPYGLSAWNSWQDFKAWYLGGMGGTSDWLDQIVFNSTTENFGNTAGRWDAGCASTGQLIAQGTWWGAKVGLSGWLGGQVMAAAGRATAMGGLASHWGPLSNWYMVGGATSLNYWLSGVRQLGYRADTGRVIELASPHYA